MDIDLLLFWAFMLTAGAFALFVLSLLLMRKLILSQHLSWWNIPIVILTCIVSIWSMFVAFGGFWTVLSFRSMLNIILSGYPPQPFYNMLVASIDMAIVSCQVQTAIVVAVFIIVTCLERKLFPPAGRAPLWVTMREQRLTRQEV